MKTLATLLDIGPDGAAQLERAGIRTVPELSKCDNIEELSRKAGVPLETVGRWLELAREEVQASRYRRRVVAGVTIVALLILGGASAAAFRLLRADPYSQALKLYEKADYAGAARLVDAGLARRETPELHNLRGLIYFKNSQPQQAIAQYDGAIALNPNFKLAYANKGFTLHSLGLYNQALAALDQAIRIDPACVWAYNERGSVYSDRGDSKGNRNDYELAVANFDRAIDSAQGTGSEAQWAFAHKGSALDDLGRYDQALDALNQAIRLNPQYAWAYGERGEVYTDRGDAKGDRSDYQLAVADFDKAIDLNKQSGNQSQWDYAHKGIASDNLGKYDQALDALDQAIRIDPQYAWAYSERGGVYSDRGDAKGERSDYQLAVADFDRSIQLNPKSGWAYAHRGYALRKMGRYPQALESLGQAIRIDPKYAWTYTERGLLYHEYLFQYEPAYQDDKKAHELTPSDAEDTANLAEAALTSGRFDEASNLANEVLAREGKDKSLGTSEWLSMRFVMIASLLLRGKAEQAKPRPEEFARYYQRVSPGLQQTWIYSGTRNFITRRPMDASSRNTLLQLLDTLQNKHK